MRYSAINSLVMAVSAIVVLCMVNACGVTVKTTESSTQTFQNTTDASSKFTSSTSPGGGEESAQREQALAFSRVQLERIKTDMAVGGGEHLASLATLLGVPSDHQPAFFALSKANFTTLFSTEPTTAEDLLARLDDQLAAHPNLLP